MAKDRSEPDLDRELADLPPELRWREWMRRIEAVLFASASPVPREDLVRVVGPGASVIPIRVHRTAHGTHSVIAHACWKSIRSLWNWSGSSLP